MRLSPEIEGWKSLGSQLRFTVTGWHQKHEPVNFSTLHPLKLLGNGPVMRCGAITLECVLSERYQALGRVRSS